MLSTEPATLQVCFHPEKYLGIILGLLIAGNFAQSAPKFPLPVVGLENCSHAIASLLDSSAAGRPHRRLAIRNADAGRVNREYRKSQQSSLALILCYVKIIR